MRILSLLLGIVLTLSAPNAQFAPGNQRVTVTFDREPDHRAYCIYWEGPNIGSSCRQVDEHTPHTIRFTLKDLPAGYYEIWATVYGGGREQSTRHQNFEVIEPGGIPS